MIWLKNSAFLQFLLAISVVSVVSSQEKEAKDLAQNADEDTIDLTPSLDLSPEKTENDRGAGQIVGQSLFPPALGQGIVSGPLNLFGLMFPALNSLLLLGNLFPAPSLLGQPSLLGPSQQLGASQNDEVPSASKVVLVLAEDRNPHAAIRAANQEAARTIRQNDMFSQLLEQLRQIDFGQMLLEQMQQQNTGQMLQQIVPQEVSQSMGQLLSQALQQFPPIDLSQWPVLGQALTPGEPTVGAALEQAGDDSPAPAGNAQQLPTPAFQLPNFQSAIDAGSQMLGQAFQPLNADSNSGFQLPNFQSAIDAGSQMLGQALQQANADTSPGAFQFPNIQSVIDSGSQMLSQSGSLFNLRPMQSLDPSMSSSDAEPAASQISEVRVKPDSVPRTRNPSERQQNMRMSENMDEPKMMAALQKALVNKKLPILWFRIPTDSREENVDLEPKHYIESKQKNWDESKLEDKLFAFQRQVISELKLLQNIERQAKEMRSASKEAADKVFKDSQHSSFLSKIPVHKITRADIEKALNDEYVKKLMQKAAIVNRQGTGNMYQQVFMPSGANFKRQAMTSTPTMAPRQMSREDIVRLMAYAYRMANANGIQMLQSPNTKKPTKETDEESRRAFDDSAKPTDTKTPSQITTTKSMSRQWAEDRMQMPQTQNFKQNPAITPVTRQMQEKVNQYMGRQWLDEQKTAQEIPHQKFNSEDSKQGQTMPITEQPRQTMEQMPQMFSQHTPDQRQWVDQEMDTRSWMQENHQMPIQRQWIDSQTNSFPDSIARQQQARTSTPEDERTWAEQLAKQQPSMLMKRQPKAVEQLTMDIQQQPTMDIQQQGMDRQQPPVVMQQDSMAMQQPTMDIQQQRMAMQQPQLAMQQPQATQPPEVNMMMLQEMQPELQRQMHSPDILGKATPQTPENEEKARFKGVKILDEFDLFGVDWKRGFKGKLKPQGSLRPTIINYYYNLGGRQPSYGYGTPSAFGYSGGANHGSSYQPSYSGGTVYGSASAYGGGYGGSGYAAPTGGSYRMAVGDDEIQAMLREHSQMKMMPTIDSNTVITENVPTLGFQSTKSATDNISPETLPAQTIAATLSKEDKQNSTKTTLTAASPAMHSSKMSRLDCKLRLNGISDKGKTLGDDFVRHKRNANFGSLQAIDANSLNELRKTYKDSLKEITLKPDEDPAEALLRYNEASIRNALEHANQEPMEISTDEHAVPTIETQGNSAYCSGAQMQVLNHEHTAGHVLSQSQIYVPAHNVQHNHYKLIGEPHNPHLNIRDRAIKILTLKDYSKSLDKMEIMADTKNSHETSITSKKSIDAAQSFISTLPESEMKTVLELITHQMQMCCDKCRDRIISSIKANIKESHSGEIVQKNNKDHAAKLDSVAGNTSEDKPKSDDNEFNMWLREMEAKGYDSKYLTKSHHWEYLNSGKLTLAAESNEGDQHVENKISKKATDHQQSFKRYTHVNSLPNDDNKRSIKSNTSSKNKGKAFAKKIPESNYSTKEHAHVVNDELRYLKEYSEEATLTPYALRGKFKNIKVSSRTGISTETPPVKFSAMSQQPHTGSTDETNKAKVVELLSLLYDLSPRTESVNAKPTQLSVMVMPIVATSTESPEYINTTSKSRTKRGRSRRRQKAQSGMVTHVHEKSAEKR